MRPKILTLIILLLLLFTFTPSVSAAPSVTISPSSNRHYITLAFTNLKGVARISYSLVYNSSSRQTGFEGGFRPKPKITRSSRRQILGTCSSGKCVYHPSPRNFHLEATFTYRSGGSTTITKSLP